MADVCGFFGDYAASQPGHSQHATGIVTNGFETSVQGVNMFHTLLSNACRCIERACADVLSDFT
jgi:hypothetical protein